jgi:hypothetical protein
MVNAIHSEFGETINKQVKKLQSVVGDQKDETEWLVVRINIFYLDTEENQGSVPREGCEAKGRSFILCVTNTSLEDTERPVET